MTVWTVVAPGPSARDLDVHTWSSWRGPIVVVNSAVALPVPRHFWAANDTPKCFMHMLHEVSRDVLVWTREVHASEWVEWGFRTWPHVSSIDELEARYGVSARFTVLVAITRCVILGASRVDVYGADMKGEGYATGDYDRCQRSSERWEKRWNYERGLWDEALPAWKELGADVCRL